MSEYTFGVRGDVYKRVMEIKDTNVTFEYVDINNNSRCFHQEYKCVDVLSLAKFLVGVKKCKLCTQTIDVICSTLRKSGSCQNVIPIVENTLYMSRVYSCGETMNCLFVKTVKNNYWCETFSNAELAYLYNVLTKHLNL